MKEGGKNKTEVAIAILDWGYYIAILATVVIYFLYHKDATLRWLFLAPVAVAIVLRLSSSILKQKKGKQDD